MKNSEINEQLDGIAIIGMSGRFPGATNVEEFWANIVGKKETISFFSESELIDSLGETARELINDPHYVKAGGILSDVESFDAQFFGYNPKEAEILDPQQRLFLTCAWEAMEDAGYFQEQEYERIGVFAGVSISTYIFANLLSYINPFTAKPGEQMMFLQGNDKDHISTRTSYKLNLKGPSVNVQTACSTSLVAVHLACQSILNGECDLALAGGASIRLP